MFYSDDPVLDYERYCDYQDRQYREWAQEEERRLEDQLEDEDALKDWLDTFGYDQQEILDRFEELYDTSNLSDDEYIELNNRWLETDALQDDVVLKQYEKYIKEKIDELWEGV